MKIKDFLENYEETKCHIIIIDEHDFSSKTFSYVSEAIDKFGYYSVKSWCIVGGLLRITIRSQF